MPVGGATSVPGVGGVQQNANTQNIKEPSAKVKFGSKKVSQHKPDTLFLKYPSKYATSSDAYTKELVSFNISKKDPRIFVQQTDEGIHFTFNASKGEKAGRGFLKKQEAILVKKGYTKDQAHQMIKDLSKGAHKHKAVIKDAVSRLAFVNDQKQVRAELTENQLMQKGYSREDAKQMAFDLVATPGTSSDWVADQVDNIQPTPKAREAMDILEEHGFAPEESATVFGKLMKSSGGDVEQVLNFAQRTYPVSGPSITLEDLNQAAINESIEKDQQNLEILGLGPDATRSDVDAAFRTLSRQYHPDKNPEGAEMFQKLNASKTNLRDSLTFDGELPKD